MYLDCHAGMYITTVLPYSNFWLYCYT